MKLNNCLSFFVLSEAAYNVAALPAFAEKIDMHVPVPLNHFKKRSDNGDPSSEIGGHNIPIEHLTALLKDSLAGGFPSEMPVKKRSTFDAASQLIDVTGEHEFIMPDFEAGQVRGPCPGLNAMANHGYLPRDGFATITQYIEAANLVWGMGVEIGTILAVYGTIFGGNLVALTPGVSMGGQSDDANSKNLLDNLLGLSGQPRGLSGTHNIFEVDASPTRGDLYDPIGDNTDLNMTYFESLYNKQKDAEVPNYTMDIMFDWAEERWYQDVAYNPNFVYLPWSGWFIRNAAIIFSGRLFVNCSEEYPDGILGKEGLKSIYGVSGPEDNMVYNKGSDRIPENYYRRADDLTLPEGFTELVLQTLKHPVLFSIGGNTNGVNTFAGLDLDDITGAAFNATQLFEGNNAICFAFQFVKEFSPNFLSSIYATVDPILSELTSMLDTAALSLDCPAFDDLSVNGTDLFTYITNTYPGAAKSGGAI